MPSLSVWCIRISLLYLGLGFTLGAVMLSSPAIRLAPLILKLRPLHAEVLLIGWLAQLAFGVAYWILPRLPGIRSRGSEPLAWFSLILLNVGILTVGLGQTFNAPATVTIFGRLTEALAVCAFAMHAWPRARTYSNYRSSTT